MKIKPKDIKEINRIFHDLEAETYDLRHPEIQAEKHIWEEILVPLSLQIVRSNHKRRLSILDYGCGTGFVAARYANHMRKSDKIICVDISKKMLNKARDRLRPYKKFLTIDFLHGDIEDLKFEEKMDLIAMNSVLHHLPTPMQALKSLGAILEVGGCLVIGHEPCRNFYLNKTLQYLLVILWKIRAYSNPKNYYRKLRQLYSRVIRADIDIPKQYREVTKETIKRIKKRGVQLNISHKELQKYVDIHSPTAGPEVNLDKGFLKEDLLKMCPDFQLKYFMTKNHLGKATLTNNPILILFNKLLEKIYPESGAHLFAILQKKENFE